MRLGNSFRSIPFVAIVAWSCAGDAVCAETASVGFQKQLLVDDFVIAEMKDVAFGLGPVTKANNGAPLLVADRPWENADLLRLGSVFRDGDRFRMWYLMNDNLMGYAESGDGLHWTKPDLGTHEYGGNRNNNITNPMGFACFLDAHETDPEHRYKSAYGHPTKVMACLAHSADGFHWTPYNNGEPVTARAADTLNQLLWDESTQVYRLYTRTDFGKGPYGGTLDEDRGTRDMTNPDVKASPSAWTKVREWHFDREGRWEFKRRQSYSLNGWIYEGIQFGLLWCYEWPGALGEGPYDLNKRHERDVLNFYILTARGDEMWDTKWVYAEKPFIPRGPDGSFDKDWVASAPNIITWNDQHWIFYSGAKERHDIYRIRGDGETRWQCAIGLATLPLDRFVCLQGSESGGTAVTKTFVLEGDTLQVNVDAGEGEFAVEILDANAAPLPGFGLERAQRYQGVDELRLVSAWDEQPNLGALRGREIRLRFHLKNAKLYSFQVLDEAGRPGVARKESGQGAEAASAPAKFPLLDSRIVHEVQGAHLALGTVQKHPANPLFGEDKPWEVRFDNLYANILLDPADGLYKCWYNPFIVDERTSSTPPERCAAVKYIDVRPNARESGVCYAFSADGIVWQKPELGLVEFAGDARNNLVSRGPHGAGVFRDSRESDPAKRFKMSFKSDEDMAVAFSPDGLHWASPIPCPGIDAAGDTHNNAVWIPEREEYTGITRLWDWDRKVRQVGYTHSPDFVHWSKAEVVLEGAEQHLQVYAMPVFRYAGLYLGLPAIFDTQADRVHTELAWSTDAHAWQRICPGVPLIAYSDRPGDYDWGCVYAAASPVCLPEEIRLYYGGSDGPHTSWRKGYLCLATLRPDGFAGYVPDTPDGTGVVTTALLTFTLPVSITADMEDGGAVSVALIDEAGKPLATAHPGTQTVTSARLDWKQAGEQWPNSKITARLEFTLKKA
ncbi:MAG: hypothetical protein HYZ00_13440 [Candidatus Hydrogenedentes bacterium]|nr:hypothetical protein [Candidatus Hydrogenedentota bacterium]